MSKTKWLCLSVCLLLAAGIRVFGEDPSPAEQYKQERLTLRAYERFLYAKEMLENSSEVGVIDEAVQDAVRYATNRGEDEQALGAIESAISRLPNDGDAWREATLARGKMLTRLDRKAS